MKGHRVSHVDGWKVLSHTHPRDCSLASPPCQRALIPQTLSAGELLYQKWWSNAFACVTLGFIFPPKQSKHRMKKIPQTLDLVRGGWLIICYDPTWWTSPTWCQNESLTSVVGHTVLPQMVLFQTVHSPLLQKGNDKKNVHRLKESLQGCNNSFIIIAFTIF